LYEVGEKNTNQLTKFMERERKHIKALQPLAQTQEAINKAIASIDLLEICGCSQSTSMADYVIAANMMSKANIPKQIKDSLIQGHKSFIRFRWPTKEHIYSSCKTRGAMIGMQIRQLSIRYRQGRITSIQVKLADGTSSPVFGEQNPDRTWELPQG